jgi:CBS domain-containing protein
MNIIGAKEKAHASRKKLVVVTVDTPVAQAMESMQKNRIHHLVVFKDGNYFGMVSDRDLLAVSSGESWIGASRTMTVGEATHFHVPIITEEADVLSALSTMLKSGVTALPVEKEGKIVDVITESDLLRLVSSLLEKDHRFSDIWEKGEVALSNPLAQNLMKVLSDAGI